MSEERLRALEELTAHQAKTIEELSTELALLGEAMRKVQRKIEAISERFHALEETVTPPAEARRPPHW